MDDVSDERLRQEVRKLLRGVDLRSTSVGSMGELGSPKVAFGVDLRYLESQYLENQWPIIMGCFGYIMGYFGV